MRLVFVLHSMTQVCMEHVQCSIKLVLTSNTESSVCGIFVCFGCIHSMLICLTIKYYYPGIYVNITLGRNICSLNPQFFDYISARSFVSYDFL